jgi:hypothetical protein
MTHELEQFISQALLRPHSQIVEETASDIQETHDRPDPYVYKVRKGKLYSPTGIPVESMVRTDTVIQKREYLGFKKIQNWAGLQDSGIAIWFSPNYLGVYDASKFIISEIFYTQKEKVLFNRSVKLDMDAYHFLRLANELSGCQCISPEELRACPVFPNRTEFARWFSRLSAITSQADMIATDQDLLIKTDVYAGLEDIADSISVEGRASYQELYSRANSSGMIGAGSKSCESMGAFAIMYAQAKLTGELKIIKCKCGLCKRKVDAIVKNNRIYCPKCHGSAPYHCI